MSLAHCSIYIHSSTSHINHKCIQFTQRTWMRNECISMILLLSHCLHNSQKQRRKRKNHHTKPYLKYFRCREWEGEYKKKTYATRTRNAKQWKDWRERGECEGKANKRKTNYTIEPNVYIHRRTTHTKLQLHEYLTKEALNLNMQRWWSPGIW